MVLIPVSYIFRTPNISEASLTPYRSGIWFHELCRRIFSHSLALNGAKTGSAITPGLLSTIEKLMCIALSQRHGRTTRVCSITIALGANEPLE